MKTSINLFLALTLSVLMWANTASADGWPASVVGNWNLVANNFSTTLRITSQSSTGLCRRIVGTFNANNPILGFYCPFSGRIHFLRKFPGTNVTFQAYSGNLSQIGPVLRIGGIFASVESPGAYGEYSFYAVK